MHVVAMLGGGGHMLPNDVNLAPRGSEDGAFPSACVAGLGGARSPSQNGLANALSGVANLARNISFSKQQQQRQQHLTADDDSRSPSFVAKQFELRRPGLSPRNDDSAAEAGGGDLIEGFPERRVPSSCRVDREESSAHMEMGLVDDQRPSPPGPSAGLMRRSKSQAHAASGGTLPTKSQLGEDGGGWSHFDRRRSRGSIRGVSSAGLQREPSRPSGGGAGGNVGWDNASQDGPDKNHGNAEWGDMSSLGAACPGVGMGGAGLVPTQLLRQYQQNQVQQQQQQHGSFLPPNPQQQLQQQQQLMQQQLQAQQQTLLLQQEIIRKQQKELLQQQLHAQQQSGVQPTPASREGKVSMERIAALQNATEDAFTSAQSLLEQHQEAMSAQAQAIKDKKRAQKQQRLELQRPQARQIQTSAAPRTVRDTLQSNDSEMLDLLNKIKTLDVEVDTSHLVYNSFERPAEMDDDSSGIEDGVTSLSAMHRSMSSAGMRRTASMHPAGIGMGTRKGSKSSYANLQSLTPSARRYQSEAALRRSRSSSGAVRSILLEARYSNSSISSMNGACSSSDLACNRPKKKASVKFTAPTIYHIAMRPLHESAPTMVFEDSSSPELRVEPPVKAPGGSPKTTATQSIDDSDATKTIAEKNEETVEGGKQSEEDRVEQPAPNCAEEATAKEGNDAGTGEKKPGQSHGTCSSESQESATKKLKSLDGAKPDAPMTMKDFLSYMNDRTVLVQQMRRENSGGSADNLVRTQSYSEGGMLRGKRASGRDAAAAKRHPGQSFADAMGLKRPEGRARDGGNTGSVQTTDHPLVQHSSMKRSETFSA